MTNYCVLDDVTCADYNYKDAISGIFSSENAEDFMDLDFDNICDPISVIKDERGCNMPSYWDDETDLLVHSILSSDSSVKSNDALVFPSPLSVEAVSPPGCGEDSGTDDCGSIDSGISTATSFAHDDGSFLDGLLDYIADPSPSMTVSPSNFVEPCQATNYSERTTQLASRFSSNRPSVLRLERSESNFGINRNDSSCGSTSNGQPLRLTLEESRMCATHRIVLPEKHPLTQEQDRNLKRIRRKIRNKVSAQHSRKRKKQYLDSVEEKLDSVTHENDMLQARIIELENQNVTMGSQLRRLQHLLLRGGFLKSSQTMTAIVILLLSTALFLIPGIKELTGRGENKPTGFDIHRSLKLPSLSPSVHDYHNTTELPELNLRPSSGDSDNRLTLKFQRVNKGIQGVDFSFVEVPHSDHDYAVRQIPPSYVVDDAPTLGYGGDGNEQLSFFKLATLPPESKRLPSPANDGGRRMHQKKYNFFGRQQNMDVYIATTSE